MAKYDVFISYRREGGYDTAKHLYDLLTRDGYKVSFDIDTLKNGDFDTSLLKRIDECKDFILIVNKGAFDRTLDPAFNPNHDWLRRELAYALKKGKNVVPVFLAGVDGFPPELPADIRAVAKKNGPQYNRYYFNDFYELLKKNFLTARGITPLKRLCLISAGVVVLLFAGLLAYVHWPCDTVNRPITGFEDDIPVPLPSSYSLDFADDIEDAIPQEVLFFYLNDSNHNYSTSLIIEDYDSYDPDDVGLQSYEQLESFLETVKVMNDNSFAEYYTKAITLQDPTLVSAGAPRSVEYDNLHWLVFKFSKDGVDQYNAVCRIHPLEHVIFSMRMKPGVFSIDWRNDRIFDRTLKALSPKLVQYLMD